MTIEQAAHRRRREGITKHVDVKIAVGKDGERVLIIARSAHAGGRPYFMGDAAHLSEAIDMLDLVLRVRVVRLGERWVRDDERFDVGVQLLGALGELPWWRA